MQRDVLDSTLFRARAPCGALPPIQLRL